MTQANDSILVTPGTGATVATHLANAKEYQVVIQADASGHILNSKDTWVAMAHNIGFAQNKSHLAIFNATGSGKIVKVWGVYMSNRQTSAVTGVNVEWDFLIRTTAQSAGTSVTPVSMDSANAAIPAQITVVTNGTITAGTTDWWHPYTVNEELTATQVMVRSDVVQYQNMIPFMREFAALGIIQPITLRETQGFSVKQITSTTVGTHCVVMVFTLE